MRYHVVKNWCKIIFTAIQLQQTWKNSFGQTFFYNRCRNDKMSSEIDICRFINHNAKEREISNLTYYICFDGYIIARNEITAKIPRALENKNDRFGKLWNNYEI